MDFHKTKRTVKSIFLLLICMSMLLGLSGCDKFGERISDKTVEKLKSEGYNAELLDEKTILIKDGNVDYYFYQTGPILKDMVALCITVPPAEGRDYEVNVVVNRRYKDRIELEYSHVVIERKGETDWISEDEETIEFKHRFSEDDLSRTLSNKYEVEQFQELCKIIPAEELQKIYDKGLEIAKKL